MKSYDQMQSAEANDAAWEATRGAVIGAAKWGAVTAMLGGAGYMFSPVYRGLTFQFKIYLQMCGMVFGSMIEADHRLRQYEAQVRLQRRIARDRAKWQQYEEEFSEPGPKSE